MMMTWTYFLHAEKRVRSQFKPETVHREAKEQADMTTLLNSMSRPNIWKTTCQIPR